MGLAWKPPDMHALQHVLGRHGGLGLGANTPAAEADEGAGACALVADNICVFVCTFACVLVCLLCIDIDHHRMQNSLCSGALHVNVSSYALASVVTTKLTCIFHEHQTMDIQVSTAQTTKHWSWWTWRLRALRRSQALGCAPC